ncbi:transcription factor [Kaistia algarum]|uniref:type II toxin-antitoxin system VapB family antitoxin n=1 Tax=Kaistia algarum TaxID=2083279 RepID=UPI000CE9252E|nr:type II toxin-antitoxin system VapB family antitoxin [Kaistia algarum]MCX5512190.1 type II toxin-antitoxin system VapB family antitoxin [Kaistia algarum]PPE80287.1 transcription factor [Kaistia algarum]
MPLNIRNEEVNRLAEKLAKSRGMTKTDAVRMALENELRSVDAKREKLRELQAYIRSFPSTGLEADKAFYDSLNDE